MYYVAEIHKSSITTVTTILIQVNLVLNLFILNITSNYNKDAEYLNWSLNVLSKVNIEIYQNAQDNSYFINKS